MINDADDDNNNNGIKHYLTC